MGLDWSRTRTWTQNELGHKLELDTNSNWTQNRTGHKIELDTNSNWTQNRTEHEHGTGTREYEEGQKVIKRNSTDESDRLCNLSIFGA